MVKFLEQLFISVRGTCMQRTTHLSHCPLYLIFYIFYPKLDSLFELMLGYATYRLVSVLGGGL